MKLIKSIMIFFALFLLLLLVDFLFFNSSLFAFEFLNQKQVNSNIQEKIYIMPYIGDIDGEVSEEWFFFYKKLLDFHEENKMHATFSFYPSSIGDEEFNKIFLKMYNSDYIELMQKGYKGDEKEKEMYKLDFEGQRDTIKMGQDVFKQKMAEILNEKEGYVKTPIAYNQIGGSINNDTVRALESLGFKIYFDMFVGDYINPVESTKSFDVIEYGVSFTETGDAGKENKFKDYNEIFNEVNEFNREDVSVLVVNGRKVIPIWAHQQDFEDEYKENKLDKEKWEKYTVTIKSLQKDSNVIFITPNELYNMRHEDINVL